MPRKGAWMRFSWVAAMLAGTALLLHWRGQVEASPPRKPLASFPLQLGNWQGSDIPIPQPILDVLGAGEFTERNYSRNPEEPSINLFLAYFPSQRMGVTMHSPQNCLPGAGWAPVEAARINLAVPGAGQIRVNRYIVAKGLDRALVLYWYQEHGRAIASEYWAKFYLVADSIQMNRSDGALVRVITPIDGNEDLASAQQRVVTLVEDVLPLLDGFIPP